MASNVEMVQGIYQAFGSGNIPAIIECLAEDVAWDEGAADHGVPWLTPGRGKEHVGKFFASLGALEFTRFDIEKVLDGGDMVVAVLQVAATVKATGGTFEHLEGHVWRFGPDGRVTSFNHLADTHQHVKALRGG